MLTDIQLIEYLDYLRDCLIQRLKNEHLNIADDKLLSKGRINEINGVKCLILTSKMDEVLSC